MDVRLLGPFEVWRGADRLALGAPKQQALLAQLAIRVGEVVPAETLIDGLWPDGQPPSAAKSVQVYVSNLRRVLPPGSIATRGAGYQLTIDPDGVDAVRFERLVATARTDSAANRSDAASAALRDGLALWRGEALETFRDEVFAIEPIAALRELRLSAIELSFRIGVAHGRGPDVVTGLQLAVREEPLREGLVALLMQALYQAGRQAEALATYHQARQLLDDELGLDPSPELQRMERSILLQDADLLGPRAGRRTIVGDPEQKLATILVAIPGALPTDDPERQLALLDRFGEAVEHEIERTGGIAQRLPDGAVRGMFGVPSAIEDHANRAVEAASRARTRVRQELDRELQPQIGLDTGYVVVQASGGGTLVVGVAASQAARLAELAEAGVVLVGERTAAAATRSTFDSVGETTLDGRRLRYAALVDGASEKEAPRPRTFGFVGRKRELRLLAERYRSVVANRTPSMTVLIGDAGVGKTRLAQVASDRRSRSGVSPRQLLGRCVAYGEARSYRPLADMLRGYLRIPAGAAATDIPGRLGERSILGLAFGLEGAGDVHPLAARERLHSAVVDLVNELVRERPLALTVEDLHWADQSLLDLLGRLNDEVSGPLFVVATARPEFIDTWNAWRRPRSGYSALWLEPLSSAEATALVAARSGDLITADWRTAIMQRAEGNPFFLEELVESLRELAPDQPIPDSIQNAIAARIDLLSPHLRQILQVAAVIGREFYVPALESVLASAGMPAAHTSALRILEEREFISSVGESTHAAPRAYSFRHALTRDVAFGTLPPGRRAALHAGFAGWLLRHRGGRDEDAADLAYHLAAAARGYQASVGVDRGELSDERAALRRQAVEWLARASKLAIGRYELDGADRLLRQAIDFSADDATAAGLWRMLAQIGYLRYDGEAFWSAMEQALRLTTGSAEQGELYSVLAETTAIRRGMWRRFPAQIRLDDWIERALQLAPRHSLARGRALVARAWTAPLRAKTRATDVREAAELVAGDIQLQSHVLGEQAREEIAHYRFAAARETIRRHLELEAEMNDPDEQALVLQQAVANLLSCGAGADAAEAAERLEKYASRLSPHHRVHAIASEVSVRTLVGAPRAVLDRLPEVRSRMLANSETVCIASVWSLLICVTAALRLGDSVLADALEDLAAGEMMEGYDDELGAQRIQIAILRDDRSALAELMATPLVDRWNGWFLSAVVPPYLDGLIALGNRDRIVAESRPFLGAGGLFEPYARRAVAIVGGDDRLLNSAQDQFIALGLATAATDTALLRGWFDREERGLVAKGRTLAGL